MALATGPNDEEEEGMSYFSSCYYDRVDWSRVANVSEDGAAFFRLRQSKKCSVTDREVEGTIRAL